MTKNNYKRLGDYIKKVNVRNTENLDIPLMGLSIQKCFIPSIANTIGTNMTRYKIIERDQFAYGPVTSRNGDKITIALFDDYDKALISQAYIPFEIKDKEKLLPKYLMMWFSRPEFDRYARFKSHGSARETFDWEEMCDVELPIPSIEKQREIVADYQAVENKIKTNEAICEKLEETAQTIYRRWFEEFEFPNKEGKPYKSNGGEMVWNEELEKEVPKGWEVIELQKITEITSGKRVLQSVENGKYPIYGAGGITSYTNDYLFDETIIIIGRVGTHGKVFIEYEKSWPSDNTLIFKPFFLFYNYFILKSLNYDKLNKGGVQALITQTDMKHLRILCPPFNLKIFEKEVTTYFKYKYNIDGQNQKLHQLQALLLGRITREERKVVEN